MKIKIPKFEVFTDSNISARMIVNPYWLEHLLNLFYQGYIGEVWEEVMDTEMNHCALIENWGYGIIGQEFHKKHLDLSNLSATPRTLNPMDSTLATPKGFNKDLTATQQVASPKPTSSASLNPNSKTSSKFPRSFVNGEQLNNRRL